MFISSHYLQMIYRTTLDHPYHCLYVILALSNASKDDKYPALGHVTGTKVPSGGTGMRGRLTKKSSTSGTSTVDEVSSCNLPLNPVVSTS